MEEYIVITGASSGIGYEMAYQLAEKKYNLILVARTKTKLQQMQADLATKYSVLVKYFVADLSDVNAAINLYEHMQKENLVVSHLVNNAGVGIYGNFSETSLDEELNMITLNISSLVALTKLFAKDMLSRKSGRIMNVASMLAFLPFPYYSVYSSTKAFVLAFSETLAAELEGSGVIITSLYPGATETNFTTDAMQTSSVYSKGKAMHPKVVAAYGVKHLLSGKGKKIVGFQNWFNSNLPRFVPDTIMMAIKKKLAGVK